MKRWAGEMRMEVIRSKPYLWLVNDPVCKPCDFSPTNRWTISFSDFNTSLQQAIKQGDEVQLSHLLNDFWICDKYMLLKSDIQGEMQ